MTKKEERVVLIVALVLLFFVLILAVIAVRFGGDDLQAILWRHQTGGVQETLSKNVVSSNEAKGISKDDSIEFFYKNGECLAGDVSEANEQHADCYVMIQTIADETDETKRDFSATIYYNNEYVLPDYDSLDFAKDISSYLEMQFGEDSTIIKRSDADVLMNAMEPAIMVECNYAVSKMKTVLENGIKHSLMKENESDD